MEGWISIYRRIVDNWIWNNNEPFDKRSAWIDLLLMVNHKTEEIDFNGKKITVERGQRITSIDKLASRWKWSRHKVSNFLNSLEEDSMLVQIRDNKKTLISIENYEKYQTQTGNRLEQKWDDNGTTLGTPNGTPNNTYKTIDNKEKQDFQNNNQDMSRDTKRDSRRTAQGHKQ